MIPPINKEPIKHASIDKVSPYKGTTVYKCPFCGLKFIRIGVGNIKKCERCQNVYVLGEIDDKDN